MLSSPLPAPRSPLAARPAPVGRRPADEGAGDARELVVVRVSTDRPPVIGVRRQPDGSRDAGRQARAPCARLRRRRPRGPASTSPGPNDRRPPAQYAIA